jgi:outer membrane biosynthesis protein TonB
MGLTDDQRAMLRLLAQNDESYEDIAALKGVSVEQVRTEVKAALAAAAAEQEASAPAQPEAPEPVPPPEEPPPPPPPPVKPKPVPKPKPPREPRVAIPPERRRLLIMAAAAIGAVGAVLIAIALIGGGSGSSNSGSSAEGSQTLASGEGAAANKNLTQAKLEPVDGGDAEGKAVFGRLQKKIVLLVEAAGLEPSEKGQSYAIWLYKSPKLAIRVAAVKVTKSGGIRAPVQLTREIFAAILARVFDRINISRTDDATYEREVAQAKKQNKLPAYSGETVLSGEVTGPVLKSGKKGSASPGS